MNLKEHAYLPLLLVALVMLPLLGACEGRPDGPKMPDQPLEDPDSTQHISQFEGIVRSGRDLAEGKQYCQEGLYLVSEKAFLVEEISMLLLRVRGSDGETNMLSDPQYLGKRVLVTGKYPAQESFCEALICECEDFILVEEIEVR